jgi:hypothetical protein
MSADIFEETERRLDFVDNPADMGPEMAWVFVTKLTASNTERLARIAAMDDIHHTAPRLAVKGGNVIPDRRAIQGLVFHPRHESGRGEAVPLDITHSSVVIDGKMESEIKSSGSGAKREAEDAAVIAGRYSHVIQIKTPAEYRRCM